MENRRTGTAPIEVQSLPKRVLVIDDEESIRMLLKEYFEILGLDAYAVASGQEGLAVLESEEFGLVLCDVSMPGMDGFEVFERVLESSPDQKFLFISGYAISGSKKHLLGQSMGLLRKPFHLNDLREIASDVYPDINNRE